MRSLLALALAAALPARAQGEPIKVAAASDLAFAFKEIGDAYTKRTGTPVVFSFGSTGLLAKQLAEGAPFDVFAAANVSFVDDLVRAGVCLADSRALYARGRIVVWAKPGSPPFRSLGDLADPRVVKVGSSRVDLQACKLEYSIVSPK